MVFEFEQVGKKGKNLRKRESRSERQAGMLLERRLDKCFKKF